MGLRSAFRGVRSSGGLLLILALALGACGRADGGAPFADSRVPPQISPRFYPPDGWAWGLVRLGNWPAQRYGVATTERAPKTHILILTGHGETAEAWFETVRELNGRGYTVWVLERAGQGGSGRFGPRRDIAHLPGLEPDVAAVKAMVRAVIRPAPDETLVVLGQGVGAITALMAVESGLPVDGVILSAPELDVEASGAADWAARLRLGWLAAPGAEGWRREGPDDFARGVTSDRRRGRVQHAWQLANPDLRMGGTSLGWRAAMAAGGKAARAGMARVQAPVLALNGACDLLPHCRAVELKGAGAAPHLERDGARAPWVAAIDTFARERIAAPPHQL